jgi:EAL domain-containing protein (putative c-di-GMP-specific phosphodiesterase class I)
VHRLSMHVCAEGVETAEAFDFLDRIGCDAIQGVLIAKPAPAAQLDKLRQNWPVGELGNRGRPD